MPSWAPLNTPIKARLQTLVVVTQLFLQLYCIVVALIMTLSPFFFGCMLLYYVWIFYDKRPSQGKGVRRDWVRRAAWWTYLRDYFPVNLIKTADLDPEKNYIFGYHPHGIISVGALVNFATEATGWSETFPGIEVSLLTLAVQFYTPFWRELLMSLGLNDVGKASCNSILSSGKGKSIAIVIGGAQESLQSKPGTADLTLKGRKGFVAIALNHGASLVPAFSFGENDLWNQVDNSEGTSVRKVQDALKKYITFTLPLFHGRGIFQYDFGLVPYRKPINTVIGAPIDLPKVSEQSVGKEKFRELVNEYHHKYMDSLKDLYDKHKDMYHKDRISDINFVQ
jgi:2-acylglycerol O-acyltransferase 2